MVRPDTYRDTSLYWLTALAGIAFSSVYIFSFPVAAGATMEITFSGSCCQGSWCPIATALTDNGVGGEVRHLFSGSETTLSLKAPPDTSPRRLWEAVERVQRRPLSLVSGGRKFTHKPTW